MSAEVITHYTYMWWCADCGEGIPRNGDGEWVQASADIHNAQRHGTTP